jgi:Uma2 family endonuclease
MALTATPPQAAQLQLKTYDDLLAMPDDGNRYELIFGEIVLSPSPKTKHQRASARLFQKMRAFVESRQLGEVFYAPFDVKFSPYNVVEPDLIYISRQNRAILGEDYVTGAPDLIVGVLSPSNRMQDLVRKAALYAQYQVAEYWIVDPEREEIVVNQWINGQFVAAKSPKGKARSVVLTGFEVTVADIFAEPEWMTSAETSAEHDE